MTAHYEHAASVVHRVVVAGDGPVYARPVGESFGRADYFDAGAELAVDEAGAADDEVDAAGAALFESEDVDVDDDSDVLAEDVDVDFDAALLSVR